MKMLILAALVMSTNAFAAKYREVIKDTVYFTNYGDVRADLVCHNSADNTFKATIPAVSKKECVESHVDHSDSTRPKIICTKWEVIDYAEKVLETSSTYLETVCVKFDYSDSKYPKCVKTGTAKKTISLDYRVYLYSVDDYRGERVKIEMRKISKCD